MMAIPNGKTSFRLVSDYHAVITTINQDALSMLMPMPTSNLESVAQVFANALNLPQGYWQMLLGPKTP